MGARPASRKDIPALAQIAKAGFASSPVYSFVRVQAEQYPDDVLESYRRELSQFFSNPQMLVMVVEKDKPDVADDKVLYSDPGRLRSLNMVRHFRWNSNRPAVGKVDKASTLDEPVGFAVWKIHQKPNLIALLYAMKSYLQDILFRDGPFHGRDTCRCRAKLLSDTLEAHRHYYTKSLRRLPQIELLQIVVSPEYQRRGYGTILIQHGLEVASKKHQGVWVYSTPLGEKLYKKVGFQKSDEVVAQDLKGCGRACSCCKRPRKTQQSQEACTALGNETKCRVGVFEWWPKPDGAVGKE